jgi:hypothetical protein
MMSFASFMSGKLIGQSLTVTNKSAKKFKFTASVVQSEFQHTSAELFEEFYPEDLPFKLKKEIPANLHKSFYIEDPNSQQLLKSANFSLAPGAHVTIVIALKTPYTN